MKALAASNSQCSNPGQWARSLGISQHAVDLYLASDVIDLHIDSYIWNRLVGYNLQRRHSPGLLRARFSRQVDIPRIRDARISGATWVITTNPLRTKTGRARAIRSNLRQLSEILGSVPNDVRVVQTLAEYRQAKNQGLHAAFIGIQGGNALDDPASWSILESGSILRVTLVHLTNSTLGQTSSPMRGPTDLGLTQLGRVLLQRLDHNKVLVDLAHASRKTFADALDAHDRTLPVLVSHTGVSEVHPHWRNLSDQQLRAVANTGGVVGIFFHGPFLGGGPFGGSLTCVAKHIAHAVRIIGAEHVALGSDWDGMICTPLDMPTCLELPKLAQALLDLQLNDGQVQMVLGGSFLRLLGIIRP